MGVPDWKILCICLAKQLATICGNNCWLGELQGVGCDGFQSHNAQTGMTMWQPWRYRDLCFYELFVKLAARAHVQLHILTKGSAGQSIGTVSCRDAMIHESMQ